MGIEISGRAAPPGSHTVSQPLPVLSRVRIASPCTADWNKMTGDDRVRHCAQCDLDVFNLAELTTAEVEALIVAHTGRRLCGRIYQRADGTMLTQDCPVGLERIRRGLIRVVAGVAAALVMVFGVLQVLARGPRGSGDLRLAYMQPFRAVSAWLDQHVRIGPPRVVMGDFAFPDAVGPTHAEELADPQAALRTQAWLAQLHATTERDHQPRVQDADSGASPRADQSEVAASSDAP